MKRIAIIGAGGLGREVLGIIKSINAFKLTWEIIGFFDDGAKEEEVNSQPILGGIKELNAFEGDLAVVVAVGNPFVRGKIVSKIEKKNIQFPNLVHPSVIMYDPMYVNLGKGIVIGANTVLTTNIRINDFVYLNTNVLLSHDTVVEEYSMLMPGVTISTGAIIEKFVYLGNGVRIDQPITIPEGTVIPIGTIVKNKNTIEEL